MSDKDLTPPKPVASDHLHLLARAILSSVPVVGGPGLEFFNHLVTPALGKRRDEWMETVAHRIAELSERGEIDIDSLANNPAFVSAVVQATTAAIKTHETIKRESLCNAIGNAVLPAAPTETKQQVFIRFVDELTTAHLQMLKLFHDPAGWFTANNRTPPSISITGSMRQVLVAAYPEIAAQEEFASLIAYELATKGLIVGSYMVSSGLSAMVSANGVWSKKTSQLGDELLAFITR